MVLGVNGNNFEKQNGIPFEIDAEVWEGLIKLKNNFEFFSKITIVERPI